MRKHQTPLPLPHPFFLDLRLFRLRYPGTNTELARDLGVSRRTLSMILNAKRFPTPEQLAAIAEELHLSDPQRIAALGLRSTRARRWRHLPNYKVLKAFADAYPEEREAVLVPVTDRSCFGVHSLSLTFDPVSESSFARRIAKLKASGWLEDAPPSQYYAESYRVPACRGVRVQTGNRDPNCRRARIHLPDVSHPASKRVFRRLRIDQQNRVNFTRLDVFADYENDVYDIDFVPRRLHLVRCRYKTRQRLYGAARGLSFISYDNSKRGGGTRLEVRMRYLGSRPSTMANPFSTLVLWDTSAIDVSDPTILRTHALAGPEGARWLLRDRQNIRMWNRLQVPDDPNHPAQLWSRYYAAALRVAARQLGTIPPFMGFRPWLDRRSPSAVA